MILLKDLINELTDAVTLASSLIAGYTGLGCTGLGSEAVAAISEELGELIRRHALIRAAIDALIALDADGYPDITLRFLDADVLAEINEHLADMTLAAKNFKELIIGTIAFGDPVAKT